ncbi:hypothetical protein C8R45DRAFT_1221105 [Mycena sanguinolenta]|nr:hypothetical protein C8R45DRAFT_1221105 [Mycena sanguinolenta]
MPFDSHPTRSAVLPDVDALLNRFGDDIMRGVVLTIVESICCSAYSIFFAIAMYSIFRKGLKSRAAIIMLCVVVYLYVSSVAQWALNVWTVLQSIHSLLMVPGVPIADRPELTNTRLEKTDIPMEALWVFNMIIGDSVVIWRTWVVHMHRVLAISMPAILLFMSLTFGLIDLGCVSYEEKSGSLPAFCTYPPIGFIGWAFSVATNITCTILIGLKARQHRKITRQLDPTARSHRMSADKILSLLVESGAIYTVLWLTQVTSYIGFPPNSPVWYLWAVLRPIGNQMAGLYPTLIIVIVNFRQTFWDDDEPATIHIDSLLWAPNSNRSRMTNTVNTQRRGTSVHIQSVINITSEEPSMGDADKHLGLAGDSEV